MFSRKGKILRPKAGNDRQERKKRGQSPRFVSVKDRSRPCQAALLTAAASWAAAHDLRSMLDVVDDAVAARALYERLGWHLADRRVAEWTSPAGVRPQLVVYVAPEA